MLKKIVCLIIVGTIISLNLWAIPIQTVPKKSVRSCYLCVKTYRRNLNRVSSALEKTTCTVRTADFLEKLGYHCTKFSKPLP